MSAKRLIALFVLAFSSAFAQVAVNSTPYVAPRQHGPRIAYALKPETQIGDVTLSYSYNWSGYAVTGSGFSRAEGSWIVPTVDCSATPSTYSSFWVGIDGWTSPTVEQTGTDSDCSGSTPTYYAWYEFYPAYSIVIPSIAVAPGDYMYGQVVYNGSEFTVTITNESNGQTFSTSQAVAKAKRTSAEWIAESPCCTSSGGLLPLSDFGTVDFGEDYTGLTGTNYATNSKKTDPIGKFSHVKETIMETKSGQDRALPSSLSSDDTSFTVTWESE
jgi:hypothetical protein